MADETSRKEPLKRRRSDTPSSSPLKDTADSKQMRIESPQASDQQLSAVSAEASAEVDRARSPSEEGEERDENPPLPDEEAPPLPDEEAPPLPEEEPPLQNEQDDGWEPRWDYSANAWYYFNRITAISQWENPRVPTGTATEAPTAATGNTGPPGTTGANNDTAVTVTGPPPNYTGYNPKIHGDFDPNADYAKWHQNTTADGEADDAENGLAPSADDLTQMYEQRATFNRFTGSFQTKDRGPDVHNDENKSKRQMEAFFDVDKAANAHDGRSLKAQRQRQKLSKRQIQEFNDKKKAKKVKKDRDWLTS